MRKFSIIEKTSGWPTVYKQAVDLLGKAKTDEIFDRALTLTEKYEKDCCDFCYRIPDKTGM